MGEQIHRKGLITGLSQKLGYIRIKPPVIHSEFIMSIICASACASASIKGYLDHLPSACNQTCVVIRCFYNKNISLCSF